MSPAADRVPYVGELEGVRGLMALWVVIGHWAASLPIHIPGSQSLFNVYAVHVFVLLSGFVIAFLLDNAREEYWPYITRRFLRLAPAYYLYLAISTALIGFSIATLQHAPPTEGNVQRVAMLEAAAAHPWPHIIAHVLGIQALIPDRILPFSEYTLLGQAWSISLEWQFYLVAPVLLLLLRGARRPAALAAILAIAIFSALTAGAMPRGYLGNFIGLFGIGIGSYLLLAAQHRGHLPRMSGPYLAAAGLILAMLFLQRDYTMLPYVVWTAVMAIVLLNRAAPTSASLAASAVLRSPPIEWLGRLSYSVYLSHMLFLILAMRLLEGRGLGVAAYGGGLLAVTLVGTLVASALVYQYIERPFIALGKRLGASGKLPGEHRISVPVRSATEPD